jgi:hypothetical protein
LFFLLCAKAAPVGASVLVDSLRQDFGFYRLVFGRR